MSEFARVTTLADLETLSDEDCFMGYRAGLRGEPEPLASVFSRAYWHGWRNGHVDGGFSPTDVAQQYLARATIQSQARLQ